MYAEDATVGDTQPQVSRDHNEVSVLWGTPHAPDMASPRLWTPHNLTPAAS
jgi:hypothetical protein